MWVGCAPRTPASRDQSGRPVTGVRRTVRHRLSRQGAFTPWSDKGRAHAGGSGVGAWESCGWERVGQKTLTP
ncbi:hypothetical protein SNE510_09960 [Streptomyces sp. NE5-10]|nr:hypothetical protein SNE510_09960 [Streptomyces sp. NE5-10]